MSDIEGLGMVEHWLLSTARVDWQRRPFGTDTAGSRWRISTNGWAALCVRDAYAPSGEIPDHVRAGLEPVLFAEPARTPAVLATDALRAWIAQHYTDGACVLCRGTARVVRPRCRGSKTQQHRCNCEHCSLSVQDPCRNCFATGEVVCHHNGKQELECLFHGRVVDMVKLLNTVGRVHGLVTFMMGSTDEHPHRFFGNGWRLVLMGVVLQGEDEARRPTLPSFPEQLEAAAALERELAERESAHRPAP